jgi:transposase
MDKTRFLYRTELVDLERHRVVDLLPDRQAAISGEETAKQKDNTGAEISPPATTPSRVPVNRAQQAQRQHREQRLRLYQTILAHHHAGKSLRRIAKAVQRDWRTVRRYLRADSFPERATRSYQPSKLDPLPPYLQQRWALGCHNAAQLFREIAAQGFTGRLGIVRQTLQAWHHPKLPSPAQEKTFSYPTPSPRQASGWLLDLAHPPNDPESARRQQVFITQLCKIQPELNSVRLLANDFIRYVRQRQAGELSSWLTRAKESAVQELRSFALSLQQDEAAVSAAFQLPWSNGQTEGQVNRLKCIKRMMYGRASFGLLRARVLHSI